MKKIANPYINIPGYNCFGCSPGNETGLKMEFFEDGDYICSDWMPESQFQGYKGVLHGGIQQTLMDEVASWVVTLKIKTAGMTSRMETRFLRPVLISAGPLHLKARKIGMKRNFAEIEVSLFDNTKTLCASSVVTYFTVNEKQAREKFFYPGSESFYESHLI